MSETQTPPTPYKAIIETVKACVINGVRYPEKTVILSVRGDEPAVRHLAARLGWSACRVHLLGHARPLPVDQQAALDQIAALQSQIDQLIAERDESTAKCGALADAVPDEPLQLLPIVPDGADDEWCADRLAEIIPHLSDEALTAIPGLGAKSMPRVREWAADRIAALQAAQEAALADAAADEPAATAATADTTADTAADETGAV